MATPATANRSLLCDVYVTHLPLVRLTCRRIGDGMSTARTSITRAIRANTAALAGYLDEHERYPWTKDPAEQRALHSWIRGESAAFREGLLGPRIVTFYDEHLPGWSLQGDLAGHEPIRYHRRAQECADYFAVHGRYPSKTAKDPVARSLGEWLHRRRLGAHGNREQFASTGGRVALLDRLAPGWDTTKSEVWVTRARAFIEFVYAEGRYPGLPRRLPEECALGEWFYKFNRAVSGDRRGGGNPWQVAFMDLHLPGWQARAVPGSRAKSPASLRDVWRAPRQGDVVSHEGRPALAIRPSLNPTDPVVARLHGETRTLDAVPHQILAPRSARSIALAQEARAADQRGSAHPYSSVDLHLATHVAAT